MSLPTGLGLWAGFLDRIPSADAVEAVKRLEKSGVTTIWLQEYSGVDPFVRASLYLQATESLQVCLGVATIHARDPEAMVAVSSTLEEAFPGRFGLGMGASHQALVEKRGGEYSSPLATMRSYIQAMDDAAGARKLPPRALGAMGPKMLELAGSALDGAHTYFMPVNHTAAARAAVGQGAWLAPPQFVVLKGAEDDWRDTVRPYFGLCLGMPNYRANLIKSGFTEDDLNEVSNPLVEALAVPDQPEAIAARVAEHRAAGADHVVLQFVPPPAAEVVLARIDAGMPQA